MGKFWIQQIFHIKKTLVCIYCLRKTILSVVKEINPYIYSLHVLTSTSLTSSIFSWDNLRLACNFFMSKRVIGGHRIFGSKKLWFVYIAFGKQFSQYFVKEIHPYICSLHVLTSTSLLPLYFRGIISDCLQFFRSKRVIGGEQ